MILNQWTQLHLKSLVKMGFCNVRSKQPTLLSTDCYLFEITGPPDILEPDADGGGGEAAGALRTQGAPRDGAEVRQEAPGRVRHR